jgi:hypothetical protein
MPSKKQNVPHHMKSVAQKSQQNVSIKTIYVVIIVVALLFIVAIFIAMSNKQDSLTSWATIKSQELHLFLNQCKDTDGILDVRDSASHIVFVCQYKDHTVEYLLSQK